MTLLIAAAVLAATPATPRPILAAPQPVVLFIGNSFTFGATSAVFRYRADTVTDLNHDGIGGVPALFGLFTRQSGSPWRVALETSPGKSLQWHWDNRRARIDRRWDAVVMQEYSTLDPDRPGDPGKLIDYSGRLSTMLRARNPRVRLALTATWSRPDLTYPAGKPWSGQPITRMALDIRSAADAARRAHPQIGTLFPVGEAFNCAIAAGIADANPYDGTDAGKVDLWGYDHYHAATPGYYLEALVIFAALTRRDPRVLGKDETAAMELGLSPDVAAKLQAVAWSMTLGGGCPSSMSPN